MQSTFWIGGSRLSGNVINLIIIAKIIIMENYGILVAFPIKFGFSCYIINKRFIYDYSQ